MLRSVFGLPRARTTLALRQASRFGQGDQGEDALSLIVGSPVSHQELEALFELLPGQTAADGAPRHRLCFDSVEAAWLAGNPRSIARAAATSRDVPSQLVAASMLAAMRSFGDGFASKLTAALQLPFSTGSSVRSVSIADRVLAAVYALDAKRPGGLDLGGMTWSGAPPGWRFRAAPWILPVLDPERPAAVVELLSALRGRNLRFAGIAERRMPEAAQSDVEIARNMAASAAPRLTRWFDRPMWIDLASEHGPQILLTQDDEYAYAWVGRRGGGVLVAFDTESFSGYGLDEPDSWYALAAAIGWYIDLSVALRKAPSGTSSVRRQRGGSKLRGYSYVPTPSYGDQYRAIASGTSRPHGPIWWRLRTDAARAILPESCACSGGTSATSATDGSERHVRSKSQSGWRG